MAESTLPGLYQAVTVSYPLRQILHACRDDGPGSHTLCGRKVDEAKMGEEWTPDIERACQKCTLSRAKMIRAHEGWE